MKITDVVIHPLQADHGHLTWTAHEPFARPILTLVEVRTDEGIVGIGEVASGPQSDRLRHAEDDHAGDRSAGIRAVTSTSGT